MDPPGTIKFIHKNTGNTLIYLYLTNVKNTDSIKSDQIIVIKFNE